MVAPMILWFSVLGLFLYFLLFPLIRRGGSITWYEKIFLPALIPQSIMLLWAISIRVQQYGITEPRYLVMIFGVWLLLFSVAFTLRKKKDIRLLPLTLCGVCLLSTFGPWGMYSVSRASQTYRLEQVLAAHNLYDTQGMTQQRVANMPQESASAVQNSRLRAMEDGQVIPFDDRKEISQTADYLIEHHGQEYFLNHFGKMVRTSDDIDLSKLPDWMESNPPYESEDTSVIEGANIRVYHDAQDFTKALGFEYVSRWEYDPEDKGEYHKNAFLAEVPEPLPVDGFSYLWHTYPWGEGQEQMLPNGTSMKYDGDTRTFSWENEGETETFAVADWVNEHLSDEMLDQGILPPYMEYNGTLAQMRIYVEESDLDIDSPIEKPVEPDSINLYGDIWVLINIPEGE